MDFLVNDFELWRSCKLPTFHVCWLKKNRFPGIGSWDNLPRMATQKKCFLRIIFSICWSFLTSHKKWKPSPSPVLDLLDTSQKTKAWFRIWSFYFSWSQKIGLIPWGPYLSPTSPSQIRMTDIFSGLRICQCSGKVRSWGCYGNIMVISVFLGNANGMEIILGIWGWWNLLH